jgi:hypothetical protein
MIVRKWWQILAGVWFILTGLFTISNLTIAGAGVVMALLAIIVGVLLLLDR